MKKFSLLTLLMALGMFGQYVDGGEGAGAGEGAGEGAAPKFGEEGYQYAGKYKSVEDLEKGYTEAHSHFNAKLKEANDKFGSFQGAPEGDYELGEDVEGFSDGIMGELQAWGKENNLSQDGYADVITRIKAAAQAEQDAFVNEELEKMGSDAKVRLDNINDKWVAQFGEESKDMLEGKIITADDAAFYESILSRLTQQQANPDGTTPQGERLISNEELDAAMFAKTESGTYKTAVDPEYKAHVEQMVKKYNAQRKSK